VLGIGAPELVVILGLALLIFGPKKMPEIGRSLGTAMRELRRASNDFMSAIENPESDESRYDRDDRAGQFDDFEHSQARITPEETSLEPVSEHKEEETHQTKEGE
jgi:sec-independent protein translocase protein TatA